MRRRVAPLWGCGWLALLLLAAPRAAPAAELAAAAVDFAFGVEAYDAGDDASAARLFETAARENPADGTTLHWLGRTYLRLGRSGEAASRFAASLHAPEPPAAGRERVQADLALARAAGPGGAGPGRTPAPLPYAAEIPVPWEAPRWDLRLSGSAGHDSNPALLGEDLPLTTSSGIVKGGTGDDVGTLGLRAEVHPFYGWGGWSLGLAATADRSFHRDLSGLDLTLATGLVQLAWGGDPDGFVSGPLGYTRVPHGSGRLALLLQAGGADGRLGGDSLLHAGFGAAALLLRESTSTATRLDVAGLDRTFAQDDSGALRQGGRETSVGVSQFLFLGRRDRYLRLGFATGDRSAGAVYASTSQTALAEASIPLSRRLTLFAAGERREDRFPHFLISQRDDVTWRFTAEAVLALTDRLHWNLRGSHARRSSNVDFIPGQPLFDYRRTTVSTGFDWIF